MSTQPSDPIPTTVVFNAYVQGDRPARITLTESTAQAFVEGGPTEEGFSYEHITFTLQEGIVTRETYVNAKDCDGPIERWQTATCPAHLLEANNYEGVLLPDWIEVDTSQRDHYAEQAGY